jgi:hypothetical protein
MPAPQMPTWRGRGGDLGDMLAENESRRGAAHHLYMGNLSNNCFGAGRQGGMSDQKSKDDKKRSKRFAAKRGRRRKYG